MPVLRTEWWGTWWDAGDGQLYEERAQAVVALKNRSLS